MRLATLIISLILSFVVFIQSCAAAVGGGLQGEFGDAAEKAQAEELSGAAGFGVLAGLLWIVGAGLVMAKPKISMWLYGVAALCLMGAGAGGYSDAFIWTVASAIFAFMSWRGIEEKASKDEESRARYQADIAAAARLQHQGPQLGAPPPPPPPPPA